MYQMEKNRSVEANLNMLLSNSFSAYGYEPLAMSKPGEMSKEDRAIPSSGVKNGST